MLSTFHKANKFVMQERNTKQHGQHVALQVKTPQVVKDYNHGMGELTFLTSAVHHIVSPTKVGSTGRLFSLIL